MLARELLRRAARNAATATSRRELAVRQTRQVVQRLLADGVIARAWLIGSAATGTFGTRSDVDVVVEGLEQQQHGKALLMFEREVDAVVDLLQLEQLPAPFRERVISEGEPLP